MFRLSGCVFSPPLVLHPGNELPLLSGESRPDLRRGRERRRMLRSTRRLRSCLSRCLRRGASGQAEPVLTAIPPERLVGSFERRCGASARDPHAFDRVARPQPGCDLILALKKTGVRLAIWSLQRPIIELGILTHNLVIGFGGQKYSQTAHFFSSVARRCAENRCKPLQNLGTRCTCPRASETR